MTSYISRTEADELCDELIRQFVGGDTKEATAVDIDSFVATFLKCPILYENYAEGDPDKIGFTSDGVCPLRVSDGGVVEQRVYPKYTVVLEKYLLRPGEEARRRFTLAHEAGHIIASQLDPHANACFHRDIDAERLYTAEELRQRMSLSEWQANMLAGCLLMPRFIVKNALIQYNNGRKLPVYGTSVFRPREKEILGQMTRRLGVSRTALTIRLRDLGAFQYREVLGAAEGMKEDKSSWVSFFQWLRGRGLDGVKLIVGDKCLGMLEAVGEVFPEAKYQRCTVHFYRNVFSVTPRSKVKLVAKMLKAVHAQESKKAAREKAKAVVEELRSMKLKEAAKKVEDGIEETLTYCDFPSEHWTRIRTNNVIERLNREIRRRTRVVGSFPDGNSALMLVCARLRHVADTQWGNKKYMNMKHLEAALEDASIAG